MADAAALRGDSPLAVWESSDGRIVRELMAGHAEESAAMSAPPLLDGREAMAALELPPGRSSAGCFAFFARRRRWAP